MTSICMCDSSPSQINRDESDGRDFYASLVINNKKDKNNCNRFLFLYLFFNITEELYMSPILFFEKLGDNVFLSSFPILSNQFEKYQV